MMYDVLWIEDESDKNPNFLALCELKGLDITIKENSDDGLEELKRRDKDYDAVILDAKVNLNVSSSPNLKGLRATRDYLLGLNGEQFIPHFIYTGQPDYQESSMFEESFGKYYIKVKDDETLISDIIKAIQDRPNTIVRKRHPEIFNLFKNGFIDNEYEENLIDILRSLDDDREFKDELYFNQLRQILEAAMRKANDVGILHDKCLAFNKNKVTLSYATRFLSGQRVDDVGIECEKSHFPKIITDHVWSIINTTNIGSHAEKDGKEQSEASLKEYRNKLNTPYLLYSLTFKLMDVLLWFSRYVNENNNYDLNKSLWVDLNENEADNDGKWIVGTITKKQVNGWGTFTPDNSSETIGIPPYMMDDNSIDEYQKIGVITKPNPNGASPHVDRIKTSV